MASLVPVSAEAIIAGREITEPRLRPGGAWVSYVVRPPGGAAAIAAVPIGAEPLRTTGPETLLTTWPTPLAGRGAGGGCYCWIPDGSGIVYGAADGCLWRQPMTLDGPQRLTAPGSQARAPAALVLADGTLLVAHMADEASIHLLVCSNDGAVSSTRIDTGVDGFCFDPALRITSAATVEVCWLAWSAPSMPWDAAVVRSARAVIGDDAGAQAIGSIEYSTIAGGFDRDGTRQQPRWAPDGELLTVTDDHGWLNLCRGDRIIADPGHEHALPTWGPGQRSYAADPDTHRIAIARAWAGFGELALVDDASAPIDERLGIIDDVVAAQLDWSDGRLVALCSTTTQGPQVIVYDTTGEVPAAHWPRVVVARSVPIGWDSLRYAPPEALTTAREGLAVHARHYRCGAATTRLMCMVHGGPTDQWQAGFLPRVLFWITRGWDVLVVDPRGTTGHGRAYQQALHGGWGVEDVADIAASIAALHERTDCRPEHTIVIGSSSGGLGVLALLARHRELVAGGIAVSPVSDLVTLSASDSRFEAHYTDTLVGPLRSQDDLDRYRQRSPVEYAAAIGGPLLLLHGEHDPVVPVEQSRRLVAAITAAGGTVEYHEFSGEGHSIRDPANRQREFLLMEEFAERIASSPWDM